MTLPDKIRLTLFTPVALNTPAGVSALLDALGSDFTPTHWGENEQCRFAFDREKMVATIGAYPPDHYIPGVARRRPFAYDGWFVTDAGTMQKVYLEFGPPPDPAALQTVLISANGWLDT
jgi:hypothetical protein